MYSSYRTAVSARGYTFKFPTLGLPDLDRTKAAWIPFEVAIGTKEACAALLEDDSTPAPLRSPDNGDYSVIEIEYEGMVWFLPFLDPLYNLEEPEVLAIAKENDPKSPSPLA